MRGIWMDVKGCPGVAVRVLPPPPIPPPPGRSLGELRLAHQEARRSARAMLRDLVADLSGCRGDRQHWDRTPRGKPVLVFPPGLHVSLSHGGGDHGGDTRRCAAVAATALGPVGVDVETDRPLPSAAALEATALAPAERRMLAAVSGAASDPERRRLLLAFWTRKEAVVKALGSGLSAGLTSVVTDPGGKLLGLPPGAGHPSAWSVSDLSAGPGIVGALAVHKVRHDMDGPWLRLWP